MSEGMRWTVAEAKDDIVGDGGGEGSGVVRGERPRGERERNGVRKSEETERFLPGALPEREPRGTSRESCEFAVEREEEVEEGGEGRDGSENWRRGRGGALAREEVGCRGPPAWVAARLRLCIGHRAAKEDADEAEWVEVAGEDGRFSSPGDVEVGESPPRTFVSVLDGVRRKRRPVKMERPFAFPPLLW